jgi:hypothetical protein
MKKVILSLSIVTVIILYLSVNSLGVRNKIEDNIGLNLSLSNSNTSIIRSVADPGDFDIK